MLKTDTWDSAGIRAYQATKQSASSKRLAGVSRLGRSVSASVSGSLAAKTEPARPAVVGTRHIARTPLSLA